VNLPQPIPLDGRRVLVVGAGVSGLAAAAFSRRRGAEVTVTDTAPAVERADALAEIHALGARARFGVHDPADFRGADLVVVSPGVDQRLPAITAAARAGIPVMGELELACRFIHEPIVAVTGTNGKTTVTELIGRMLEASGRRVFVGGNIGTPLTCYADGQRDAEVLVLEVSSFQLDTISTFRPQVAVVLNISPDHLDRYEDMGAYARSKMRLLENQGTGDTAVLNGADPWIRRLSGSAAVRRVYFQGRRPPEHGADITPEGIAFHLPSRPCGSLAAGDIPLPGAHNRENVAAAVLAALLAGGRADGCLQALAAFQGLPHRLEWVAEIAGVHYYDDSKATNVDAVVRALEGFEAPVILIAGGRDKGGGYRELATPVARRVKRLITLGEAAPLIREALGSLVPTEGAADMAAAVAAAAAAAAPGDVVLLSPACSSFDMYASYARRGEDFARAVRKLAP
jgi:UDP-N-acetylmuramoylalanine--D-glutamate ligase